LISTDNISQGAAN